MAEWDPPQPNQPRLPDPTPKLPPQAPPAPDAATSAAAAVAPKPPLWKRKYAWIPAASLVGIIALGAIFGDPDEGASPNTIEPAVSEVTEPASETTPPPQATLAPTTQPATTLAVGPPPVAQAALIELDELLVAAPDPNRNPYNRDDYQPGGWADFDGDCITTRHDVLIAESLAPVTMSADGCRVETGQWADAYTGETLTNADEATIDHFVPLAEGHRSGGWKWDFDTKIRFANDDADDALLVVGGDVNQSKADNSPDKWMPTDEQLHCSYAMNWVDKKTRWGLAITQAEHDTLFRVLEQCNPETTPLKVPSPIAPVTITVPTTTPPTTTIPPSSGPAELVLVSCQARSEEVVIANRGREPADMTGYRLHDEGDKHSTPLGQWGPLAPSTSLTIVTGDDATEGSGRVIWKRQNVWNNDGDTAFLVGPDNTQQVRCTG